VGKMRKTHSKGPRVLEGTKLPVRGRKRGGDLCRSIKNEPRIQYFPGASCQRGSF